MVPVLSRKVRQLSASWQCTLVHYKASKISLKFSHFEPFTFYFILVGLLQSWVGDFTAWVGGVTVQLQYVLTPTTLFKLVVAARYRHRR